MSKKRDSFTSKSGFILAAVGSAVGMANVWAFPYRTAKYGGAAYIIPYLICIFILSNTGLVTEMCFGRRAKTGPLGGIDMALAPVTESKILRNIGILPVIGSFTIATGYAIITGWVIRYLFGSITGTVTSTSEIGAYFGSICGNFGSIGWHIAAIILTFLMMCKGISKGIEKINKVMMPLFFILFVIMAIYVSQLKGATIGYKYLFFPEWKFLAMPDTWIYALGQAFFSLSLAGNGTVIYGSYLQDTENTVSCARKIAIFDTLAALLAACVVIPAISAFGIDRAAGPPLMFITLPAVFQSMGSFGYVFSIIFFLAIFTAAATSIVNLYETPIEMIEYKFKASRKVAVAIVLIISFGIGIFIENGDIIGKWMDIMSIYLCPIGALLVGIIFMWVQGKDIVVGEIQKGYPGTLPSYIFPMSKYLYCGIALVVVLLGILLGGIG